MKERKWTVTDLRDWLIEQPQDAIVTIMTEHEVEGRTYQFEALVTDVAKARQHGKPYVVIIGQELLK